jgi:hypothetical protein
MRPAGDLPPREANDPIARQHQPLVALSVVLEGAATAVDASSVGLHD